MSSDRFRDLTFEGFRELARDDSLNEHEKVGFPSAYREGREEAILADIRTRLTRLAGGAARVLDIGPGCGGVARGLIEWCGARGHVLFLADSAEMLDLLPEAGHVRKLRGRFPADCRDFLVENRGRLDAILAYSVIQYVAREGGLEDFIASCLDLLAEGGQLLLGDLPNRSMRERFLRSSAGRAFLGRREAPAGGEPKPAAENEVLDDELLLDLVARTRRAGYDAFLLPQAADLPMANRREDLLIRRP